MDDERDDLHARVNALVTMGFLEKRVADALADWSIEEIEQLICEIETYLSS